MPLSQRQIFILYSLTEEFIKEGKPVSSFCLKKRHRFKISSATLRIELNRLVKKGYLYQLHNSGGRLPTDKAYKFFVKNFLSEELIEERFLKEIEKYFTQNLAFLAQFTKILGFFTSDLVLTSLWKEKLILEEGWERLFQKPEFKNPHFSIIFLRELKRIKEKLISFNPSYIKKPKIIIGGENSFKEAKNMSIILSSFKFSSHFAGIISILGPKRMDYKRNFALINSVSKKFGL